MLENAAKYLALKTKTLMQAFKHNNILFLKHVPWGSPSANLPPPYTVAPGKPRTDEVRGKAATPPAPKKPNLTNISRCAYANHAGVNASRLHHMTYKDVFN